MRDSDGWTPTPHKKKRKKGSREERYERRLRRAEQTVEAYAAYAAAYPSRGSGAEIMKRWHAEAVEELEKLKRGEGYSK